MMWLLVATGGALGATARIFICEVLKQLHFSSFWPTICVNILGSLVLGLMYGFFHARLTSEIYTMAALGFLGSFTTFSTFALDVNLLLKNSLLWTVGYIVLSVVGSIVLCLIGIKVATATA